MRAAELRVFWSLQAYATLIVCLCDQKRMKEKKWGKRWGGEEGKTRERQPLQQPGREISLPHLRIFFHPLHRTDTQ